MSTNKVISAKNAVVQMLAYYNQALVESGCDDPKREMATELAKAIALSKDQTNYLIEESVRESVKGMAENIQVLLKVMKANQQLPGDTTLDLMIGTLTLIMECLTPFKQEASDEKSNES